MTAVPNNFSTLILSESPSLGGPRLTSLNCCLVCSGSLAISYCLMWVTV